MRTCARSISKLAQKRLVLLHMYAAVWLHAVHPFACLSSACPPSSRMLTPAYSTYSRFWLTEKRMYQDELARELRLQGEAANVDAQLADLDGQIKQVG